MLDSRTLVLYDNNMAFDASPPASHLCSSYLPAPHALILPLFVPRRPRFTRLRGAFVPRSPEAEGHRCECTSRKSVLLAKAYFLQRWFGPRRPEVQVFFLRRCSSCIRFRARNDSPSWMPRVIAENHSIITKTKNEYAPQLPAASRKMTAFCLERVFVPLRFRARNDCSRAESRELNAESFSPAFVPRRPEVQVFFLRRCSSCTRFPPRNE